MGGKLVAVIALLCIGWPVTGEAQFRRGHAPENLADYHWTAWLIGEWEGYAEIGDRQVPWFQSFRLSIDGSYVLTEAVHGEGPDRYMGTGVFSYYPATSDAYGRWFGSDHGTNDGRGVLEGDRMVWTIWRANRRITRTRTRTGPDTYEVLNEAVLPDGSTVVTREVMRRVRRPAGAAAREAELIEFAKALNAAFDRRDLDAFVERLAADASLVTPFSPRRIDGRPEIREYLRGIFAAIGAGGAPPARERWRAQLLDERTGVVSVEVPVDGAVGRNTMVVHRRDGAWRVASMHVSRASTPPDPDAERAPSWEETQPDILASRVRDRYVALAAEFPDELMEWRPMEGTRSVAEVIAHAAAVASVQPRLLGIEPPGGPDVDFAAEAARLAGLSPAGLTRELEASLDRFVGIAADLSDARRTAPVTLFGRTVQGTAALTVLQLDLHEHLGQLIAYARMNRIVPPWSR